MSSVYFDPAVGGDGSTVTDDANPATGLANGGHRARFVPALAQIVAVAAWVKNKAVDMLGWANSASASASAAAASEAAAAASYDAFDDRYLGSKSANPALDNDGNALLVGALYWNAPAGEMRAWSGTTWFSAYLPSGAYVVGPAGAVANQVALFDGITGKLIKASDIKTVGGASILGTGDIATSPQWQIKTAAYTAVSGDTLRCDTTGGSFPVTMPATPTANDRVAISGNFATNNLTIDWNGANHFGLTAAADPTTTLSSDHTAIVLTYFDATNGWGFGI